jgi:GST-like protein
MLKFYCSLAPNPRNVALFLEEAGLPCGAVRVDTRTAVQQAAEIKALSPNPE